MSLKSEDDVKIKAKQKIQKDSEKAYLAAIVKMAEGIIILVNGKQVVLGQDMINLLAKSLEK
jgi:hypothetical protein